MNTSSTTGQFEPMSPKENKMNTHLNARNTPILTLAVLSLLVAAAVLFSGLLHFTSAAAANTSSESQHIAMPRVRFAALEGPRKPAALEGFRKPASLEGRRPPAALLGGRRPSPAQAAPTAAQPPSLTLIDGMIILALAALLVAPVRKASLARS